MTLQEHKRLKDEELARHLKVNSELDYRLRVTQQTCEHSFNSNRECFFCGLVAPKDYDMHKMPEKT